VRAHLGELEDLLEEITSMWVYDDLIYRFWHQSFKVYGLQQYTLRVDKLLKHLAPEGTAMHPWYIETLKAGCDKKFEIQHNAVWLQETRPIVDAFFHAKYMLEMVVKAAQEEHEPSGFISSAWAAVLELYQIR
jgi:hypothetical protein